MSTPISVQGYKKLEKELEALKKERPIVIQAIKEAREEGDLKENAGYDAARERQGFLEARINYIESQLPQYTVIDLDTLHSDKVIIGDIMLLIPGLAFTNAVKDIFIGDTISGVMRLIETILWAAALALGFALAGWLLGV